VYSRLLTIYFLLRRKTLLVTLRIEVADWVAKTIAPKFAKDREKLYLTHNAGFFSCLSVALNSVVDNPPLSISARFGMRLYKEYLFSNPWNHYFESPDSCHHRKSHIPEVGAVNPSILDWWWCRYSALPLSEFHEMIDTYFYPSQSVLDRVETLKTQHEIKLTETIGIHYRGTDKVEEFSVTDLSNYIHEVEQILIDEPNHKILLQTDDFSAYNVFYERFSENMISIDPPIKSTSGVGLHYLGKRNPVKETINYFATVLILSKCDYLITHTGNGALWEHLYRGNSNRVTQF